MALVALATNLILAPFASARRATRPRSVLQGEPGYTLPDDPDSMALITGRREAPAMTFRLTGGAASPEALVRAIFDCIASADGTALGRLCVTREEFGRVLWPEFPGSRPVTGASADEGFYFLVRRNNGGVNRLLNEFAGRKLRLVRIERAQPIEPYRNFKLHRGLTIVARDSKGSELKIDVVRTLVEHRGAFKIYSMRD